MKHSSYFHHHHHRCSDLRQVPGTHTIHSFLPSALLFIFTNEPSIRSSIIPLLGLPRGLFPNILPSNTSLSSPSPLSTCPIHSFLPSALLFIFTNEPSIRSSIIPLLGLPRGLFPNILPANTSLSSPSPLCTCPIQLCDENPVSRNNYTKIIVR